MSYRYNCFSLNIYSEIKLPLQPGNENSVIDVQIKFGKVPQQLIDSRSEAWYQAIPNQLLLKIQGIASFLVENGETITIDPQIDDNDYINAYLLGSAMGGLLHQRNYLVLHANALVINNQALLVAAPQGFGKSTLAAAFLQKGFSLLADDVCAIKFNNNQPIVYPSYPQIKLCADVLSNLGYTARNLKA